MPTTFQGGVGSDFLAYLNGGSASVTGTEDIPAWQRALTYGVTAPVQAVSNLSESIGNILGVPKEQTQGGFIPEGVGLTPGTTTAEKLVDFGGKAIAPMIMELMLTGKVVPKGIPEYPRRIISDALGFGVLGAQDDQTVGAEQAGEGAYIGAVSKLARGTRIPLLAAGAAASKYFFDQHHPDAAPIGNFMGHDWTQGDLSAAGLFTAGILPGATKAKVPLTDHFNPVEGPLQAPNQLRLGYNNPLIEGELIPPPGPRNPRGTFMGPDGIVYADGPRAPMYQPEPTAPPLTLPAGDNLQPLQIGYAGADRPGTYHPDFAEPISMERAIKTTAFRKQPQFGQQPYTSAFDTHVNDIIANPPPDVDPIIAQEIIKGSPNYVNPPSDIAGISSLTPKDNLQLELGKSMLDARAMFDDETFKAILYGAPKNDLKGAVEYWKRKINQKTFEQSGVLPEETGENATEAEKEFFRQGKIGPPESGGQFRLDMGLGSPVTRSLIGAVGGAGIADYTDNDPMKGALAGALLMGLGPSAFKLFSKSKGFNEASTSGLARIVKPEAAGGPAPGMRRLYRAENLPSESKSQIPSWLLGDPEYEASKNATGRWFSDTMENTQWYASHLEHGKISYVDIPEFEVEKFRASNLPEGKFSSGGQTGQRAKEEFFLPKDLAESRKPFLPRFKSTVRPEEGRRGASVSDDTLQSLQKSFEGKQEVAAEVQKAAGMRSKFRDKPSWQTSEGGFIIPEVSAAIGRSVIGGFAGGTIGGLTSDDPTSGFITGALLGAGAGAFGPSIARQALKGFSDIKLKSPEGALAGFYKNLDAKIETAAGGHLQGAASSTNRFVRYLDSAFGATIPNVVKRALAFAKGSSSYLLQTLDDSLSKLAWGFKPDEALKKLSSEYLTGGLPGGTTEYLQRLQSQINVNPEVGRYAQFIVTGRETVNGLQRLLLSGIGDKKMRTIIGDSLDSYLTRSYKLFTDPKFEPNQDQIQKLAKEMAAISIDKRPSPGFVGPSKVPLMGTEDYNILVKRLNQYVREIKQTKGTYVAASPFGQSIEQGILKQRKNLSPLWKQFLGEITDPTDRIYQTVFRLRPMAEASKYFERIANVVEDGRPHVFNDPAEMATYRGKLEAQLKDSANPPSELDAAKIKKNLASLDSYQYVEDNLKYGGLQTKYVSRHVWDTLKTFDSMTDSATSPWLRSIANAHTAIKLTRTALSPVTTLRNILTAPFFMAIGRTTFQDLKDAHDIIRAGTSHPLAKEIYQRGIANVDQVKSEFRSAFDNITGSKYNFGDIDISKFGMGRLDLDLAEQVGRKGFRKILDFYRYPDNLTRIGTYLAAKNRIAENMGLAINDVRVLDAATDFTNRYTMNYDALPPIVKKARQLPLFNLFLSYSAEIARIGKNLTEDLIKGNPMGDGRDWSRHGRLWSGAMLGVLAVVPELLQSASEGGLSPEDKRDWDKVQKLMPDWQRSRYKMGIQRDKKTGQFSWMDYSSILPADNYNEMGRAIANQDWKALAAVNPLIGTQNTPVINIAFSQMQGKDLHTQRAFRPVGQGGGQDRFASVAKEITPPWTPGIGTLAENLRKGLSTNAQGGQGLTDSKTGRSYTPADVFLPLWTGLSAGNANLSVLQKRAVDEAKQDIAEQMSYANDVLKMNYPEEKKKQMIDQTIKVVEAIRARLSEQIGVRASQ